MLLVLLKPYLVYSLRWSSTGLEKLELNGLENQRKQVVASQEIAVANRAIRTDQIQTKQSSE